MEDKRDVRAGVEGADATGLVAGEELITKAETVLPLLRLEHPLPHEDLHAALPDDHEAHGRIDQLHAELSKASPNRKTVEHHVHHLRLLPELEARMVLWWEDPRTQRFFSELAQIGG